MKTRVIAGLSLVVGMMGIGLAAPKWVAAIMWTAVVAIATYELLHNTELVKEPRLIAYAVGAAVACGVWSYFGAVFAWGLLGLVVFMALLFLEMMRHHVEITFQKITMTFMAGVAIPVMMCSIIRILTMSIGRYMVLVPFIAAVLNDTGGYFAGMFFGRHKLAPVISPKKTIEGAVGGVLLAMLGMALYAAILDLLFDFSVNYGFAMIYGLLGALFGMFGDLCFSVIKRQSGIKDYGNLIPGHGGALDRFDSMLLVGPLVEALLILIPVAVG